jgi:hypothetical protein
MSGWIKDIELGSKAQYYNPEFPDWFIYQQPAGFFVWEEFRFHKKCSSFAEAEAAVTEASS